MPAKPDTQTCPACNSPNLWTDEDNGKTYKHCFECIFCWNVQLEREPTKLKVEAREYAMSQDLGLQIDE